METTTKKWIAFKFKRNITFPKFSVVGGEKWMGSDYDFSKEFVDFAGGHLYSKDVEILYSGTEKHQAHNAAGW